MKGKKLLTLALSLACAFGVGSAFVSCGGSSSSGDGDVHTHVYDKEVAADEYLKDEATCTSQATYYKSCTCGEKGTDMFTYGDFAEHMYTNYVSDNNATCTQDGTKTAVCDFGCGATNSLIDEDSMLSHTYSTEWMNNDAYHWHAATCGCDVVNDRAVHTLNAENTCTACGYVMQATEGVVYQLSNDGASATVTGYNGTATDVVIASIYRGLPVTSIGESAFEDSDNLTSVEIPDSVTLIGWSAFYDCESLTSVEIGDSVTSIGDYAFSNCTSLTSVEIGDGVTSISYAFAWCESLTSIIVSENNTNYKSIDGNLYSKDGTTLIQYAIGKTATSFTIPDSVTSIGDYAFSNCTSLTNVVIPDSVVSIGWSAFYKCTSLTNVVIPDSVTSIGNHAFYGCGSLTSVEIGDGVTSIGNYAFRNCTSLTSVEIGGSVTSIGKEVFDYCESLSGITFKGTVEEWNAIPKDEYWNYGVPATEVVCRDGSVTI